MFAGSEISDTNKHLKSPNLIAPVFTLFDEPLKTDETIFQIFYLANDTNTRTQYKIFLFCSLTVVTWY